MKSLPKTVLALAAFVATAILIAQGSGLSAAGAEILSGDKLKAVVPAGFFYAGQIAPTQLRNASALKAPGGKHLVAALVDTSGYSSALAEKFQGFLLAESQVVVGGTRLAPGAYGIGATAEGRFIVTDIGGATLHTLDCPVYQAMKRPVPLKFTADSGAFRLYMGRRWVTIAFVDGD